MFLCVRGAATLGTQGAVVGGYVPCSRRQWYLGFDTSNPPVACSLPPQLSRWIRDSNWPPSGCWLSSLTARQPTAPKS